MSEEKKRYPPIAIAKVELETPEERHEVSDWLRRRILQVVAPGVYARKPAGIEWAFAGAFDDRHDHRVAAAWVRQHRPGMTLLPSVAAARHALGLGPRPSDTIGPTTYRLPGLEEPVHLLPFAVLEPAPSWMADVPLPNALANDILVALGDEPPDLTPDEIARIGGRLADLLRAVQEAVETLEEAASALPAPHSEVARVAARVLADRVAHGGIVLAARQAPEGWEPPVGPDEPWADGPTVHIWEVLLTPGQVRREVIWAADCVGHPYVERRSRMHTSQLTWIDEKRGWAHTHSRLYRLGLPDTPESRARMAAHREAIEAAQDAWWADCDAVEEALQPEVEALLAASGGTVPADETACYDDFIGGVHFEAGGLAFEGRVVRAFLGEDQHTPLPGAQEVMAFWHHHSDAYNSRLIWALTPCPDLDGRVPVEMLRSAVGADDGEAIRERVCEAAAKAAAAWHEATTLPESLVEQDNYPELTLPWMHPRDRRR